MAFEFIQELAEARLFRNPTRMAELYTSELADSFFNAVLALQIMQKTSPKLAQKYANHSTNSLTESLRQAYELQAKNPTRKLATLKELEQVVKARTKTQEAEQRDAMKAARTRLFELAKACNDLERIEAACDVLDEVNYEINIQ